MTPAPSVLVMAGASASSAAARRVAWRPAVLLIVPVLLLYTLLLVMPLSAVLVQSLQPHIEGRALGVPGVTFANYLAFAHVQYLHVLWVTLSVSLLACALGLLLAWPVAHLMARTGSRAVRRFWINLMVSVLFLDLLIRAYALALLFGPSGVLPALLRFAGVASTNVTVIQGEVVTGLLSFIVPMCALTLVGPIENINPKLREAAQTLGASRVKSLLVTDLALSVPAMAASFLVTFTLSISAFTVPLILGRGFVTFVSNLIYARFSELADFPGGGALAVLFLLLTLTTVRAMTLLLRIVWRR